MFIKHLLLLQTFSGFLSSCHQQKQTVMQSDSTYTFTNRLIHSTSPYLLQHAHNPVDWYPWEEEALEKAKKKDKPILVSIGYAACHWCHVMEHESFEDTAVAKLMNENFVCIKVDREERPDIDHLYMDAVQAMTGSGGWPLNVFLTPEQKPFYGGTYFPPVSMYERPSWTQVLQNIARAFREQRKEVEEQAGRLMSHLQGADSFFIEKKIFEGIEPKKVFTQKSLENIFKSTKERFDTKEGGFGAAPKFPSTMTLQLLLRYFHFNKASKEGKDALEQATFSIDKMAMGGIYDQIGGGFARYATDKKWLVPHFEKMLYDNALLVQVMAEAYQLTKKELYKETIEETLDYVQREMLNPEGGFYSSLDADSEGEEGKYYVWKKKEVDSLLGEKSELFCRFYDISEKGNWEGKNILNRQESFEAFAEKHKIGVSDLKKQMRECREILFKAREKRIKPALDDKIILGWNALMCSAFAGAYQALQKEEYKKIAENNIHFLTEKFSLNKDEPACYHTYKNGKANYPAFLDDYAYLIDAFINVYEINQNEHLLKEADALMEYVLENFYDEKDKMFFYTSIKQKDIVMRKKDFYDGATPSGNSTMAENLQRLAVITGKTAYSEKSSTMLQAMLPTIEKFPSSFSQWANVLNNYIHPIKEIAVVGGDYQAIISRINELFIPNKVIMGADGQKGSGYPLLKDKIAKQATYIYVCENYACKKPVASVEEARKILLTGE